MFWKYRLQYIHVYLAMLNKQHWTNKNARLTRKLEWKLEISLSNCGNLSSRNVFIKISITRQQVERWLNYPAVCLYITAILPQCDSGINIEIAHHKQSNYTDHDICGNVTGNKWIASVAAVFFFNSLAPWIVINIVKGRILVIPYMYALLEWGLIGRRRLIIVQVCVLYIHIQRSSNLYTK